jgi:hypothetical protein
MLEDIKKELHTLLYSSDNVDEITLKKNLYLMLRECIKEKEYEVKIGSYEFNITPKNLSVKYNNDQTIVEVSNEDVYFETTRDTETRFFCISQMKKSEFLMDNPLIRVTGSVTNIADVCEEHYLFELYTEDENDSIRNYLHLPSDTQISDLSLNPNEATMVHRKIKRNDPRTDVIDFLVKDKVVPVFLDTIIEKYKALPDKKDYDPNNYSELLPTLDDKKKLIRFIYAAIVDFYTDYLNENN